MARSLHPFPARMAPEIATKILPEGGGLRVLDPMCGSGTVLGVASARGHDAVGIDIDPLAVLMSDVATRAVNSELLLSRAVKAVKTARQDPSRSMPWGRNDNETHEFSRFWFADAQRIQLAKLSRAISEVPEEEVRNALRIALSRLIVTKSPKASLAADTAHSRPHRTITASDFDVFGGFEKSAKEVSKILAERSIKGKVSVSIGDSRRLDSVPDGSIDWTITSPPYLNAIDYLRGHKMSLIWLGYSIEELRTIRSSSIGAERAPTAEVDAAVSELVAVVEAAAEAPENLPLGTLKRYAHDLLSFSNEIARTTAVGGHAVLVVGNSTLRGNYIENDRLARMALESQGFDVLTQTTREIPENRRYMPVASSKLGSPLSKRMRTESVVVLRKVK